MSGGPYNEIISIDPNSSGVILLTNNGVSYPFDMTRGLHDYHLCSATPGPNRSWRGGRLRFTYLCTGQNTTLRWWLKTGNAGTSSDWEACGNGPGNAGTAGPTTTAVAGTGLEIDWRITGIARFDILNGAPGPTTSIIQAMHWNPNMEPGA